MNLDATWRSVSSAARFYNRSERTIQQWCTNGTFLSASVPTYKDRKGRYWICIPACGTLTIPT